MYRTIVIDPPWPEYGGGKIKRGADRHYRLLPVSNIPEVIRNSGRFIPNPSGCHLYLWVTNNRLKDGLEVMEKLGFRYITNLVWVKSTFGLGQYFRGQHELCLFGSNTIHRFGIDPNHTEYKAYHGTSGNHSVSSVIKEEKTTHSRKPLSFFAAVEAVSLPPRLEMFAREKREGWDSWGDSIAV